MKGWLLLAAVLLIVGPSPVRGSFRLFNRAAQRPVEVYASWYGPAYWMPAQPLVVPVFAPPVIEVGPPIFTHFLPLAQPTPAPPSIITFPPAAPPSDTSVLRPNTVYYDLYSGATNKGPALPADRVSVSIWNLTGRAIAVRIDGQDRPLAPGRSMALELPRAFTWQILGRAAESARLPAGHTNAEILIRR